MDSDGIIDKFLYAKFSTWSDSSWKTENFVKLSLVITGLVDACEHVMTGRVHGRLSTVNRGHLYGRQKHRYKKRSNKNKNVKNVKNVTKIKDVCKR